MSRSFGCSENLRMDGSNLRLFTAPMANIYIFIEPIVQVEHTVK